MRRYCVNSSMTPQEKAAKELATIKELGLEGYVKNRLVKTNLLTFIITAVVAFVLGAVIF